MLFVICMHINIFTLPTFRSTPIEALHTILLGPYKYMLRSLMGRLTSAQKEEVKARIESFSFSGFDAKLSYNLSPLSLLCWEGFQSHCSESLVSPGTLYVTQ